MPIPPLIQHNLKNLNFPTPMCPPLSLFLFSLLFFTSLLFNPPPVSAQQQQLHLSSFNLSDSPWRPSQNQILLSPNSVFAAGFRSQPTSSTNLTYAFSVWYHNLSSSAASTVVVWSANNKTQVSSSGALLISSSGELYLNGSTGNNLWPAKAVGNRNTTELVLRNDGSLIYANWSSFTIPTNTFLPNQTINGTELVSNNGKYKFIDSKTLVFNLTDRYWDAGNKFLMLDDAGKLTQENGASITSSDYGDTDTKVLRRLTLDDTGNLFLYSFDRNLSQWIVVWQAVQELCTIRDTCGLNSICMSDGSNSTYCQCPPGFRPSTGTGEEKNSCQRKIPMTNLKNTVFLQLDYVNFSGVSDQRSFDSKNLASCEANCTSEPKCLGFGFKFNGGGYCVLQLNKLQNGYWSPGTEAAMFLRVDGSETDRSNFTGLTNLIETTCPVNISLPFPPAESDTTTRNIIIIVTLFTAELVGGALFCWPFLKKFKKYRDMAQTLGLELLPAGGPKRFTYSELKAATNNFSDQVGRGGFGDVYRGELPDHRIVAVKCLKNVAGGDTEFWAEVTIIARMHHLNLVRLWGYCAEKGQRILVYEYVPNGSLDKYLFPKIRVGSTESSDEPGVGVGVDVVERKPVLDWNIRYRIALGVARAVAYLHEECLEWVLHCDIKPENILLGDDFCPKISDFGLAKLRKKEDMVSMSRIRGTRGYMAPEWAKMDPITAKADVYSFGMVLLEIVTGARNFEIQGSQIDSAEWYFPRWAFDKAFKEMRVEDILDSQIKHSYDSRAHFDMVNRMVKTAMWCLQDRPDLRPSMGKVAKMLEGSVEITEPRKPTIFYLEN